MSAEDEPSNGDTVPPTPVTSTGAGPSIPLEDLAKAAVKGITVQPFLFVIVLAVEVIGLVFVGSTTSVSDLRLLLALGVILVLATIALLGIFVTQGDQRPERGSKSQPMSQGPQGSQSPLDTATVTPPATPPSNRSHAQRRDTSSATDQQRQHLEELLAIHEGNLVPLQKQRAMYGELDVPPLLLNRIRLEEDAIRAIQQQLSDLETT